MLFVVVLTLTRIIKSVRGHRTGSRGYRYAWMAGKRLGKRDKEGVTVPLHASDPVLWPTHTPDDVSAVR